jgi:hypothetical protein
MLWISTFFRSKLIYLSPPVDFHFSASAKKLVFAGIFAWWRLFPTPTRHDVSLFLEDGKRRPQFSRELRGFLGPFFADRFINPPAVEGDHFVPQFSFFSRFFGLRRSLSIRSSFVAGLPAREISRPRWPCHINLAQTHSRFAESFSFTLMDSKIKDEVFKFQQKNFLAGEVGSQAPADKGVRATEYFDFSKKWCCQNGSRFWILVI